jgi:hypothetical protein
MSAGGLRVYSVRAARRAISNIGFSWPQRSRFLPMMEATDLRNLDHHARFRRGRRTLN